MLENARLNNFDEEKMTSDKENFQEALEISGVSWEVRIHYSNSFEIQNIASKITTTLVTKFLAKKLLKSRQCILIYPVTEEHW